MSDESPASRGLEAGHGEDLEAVGRYFDRRWTEYEKVVALDYLGHRGHFAAARDALAGWANAPYAMLDLGCGDARFVGMLTAGTPLRAYRGVDLSDAAAARARENLAKLGCSFEVEVGDAFRAPEGEVDLAFASFSMHHLTRPQKEAFMRALARALRPGGAYLLIDLVGRPGQPWEEARADAVERVRTTWTDLEDDERARVVEHVSSADYIEPPEWLLETARGAGFRDATLLRVDPRGHTACFMFRA
jgi:SAM-dependent methyltransferase